MMTTPDFIRHWVRGAERDWHAAEVLLTAGAYSQCIFLAHLTVEKLAKAHWIREHEEPDPPMWHNITKILRTTTINVARCRTGDGRRIEQLTDGKPLPRLHYFPVRGSHAR